MAWGSGFRTPSLTAVRGHPPAPSSNVSEPSTTSAPGSLLSGSMSCRALRCATERMTIRCGSWRDCDEIMRSGHTRRSRRPGASVGGLRVIGDWALDDRQTEKRVLAFLMPRRLVALTLSGKALAILIQRFWNPATRRTRDASSLRSWSWLKINATSGMKCPKNNPTEAFRRVSRVRSNLGIVQFGREIKSKVRPSGANSDAPQLSSSDAI